MKEDSIVKPSPLKGFMRKRCFIIPFDLASFIIKNRLEKACARRKSSQSGYVYLLEDSVVLFGSIGASGTILSMEQLIKTGVEEFVILGFCGSLDASFSIAEAVFINRACSDEGVSHHYIPSSTEFYSSETLTRDIKKHLSMMDMEYRSAAIVSTDAPYRETRSWVQDKQNNGISLVDMETSAVFAVAEYYGLKATSLQIISDDLSSGTWKKGFHLLRLKTAVEKYFLPFII